MERTPLQLAYEQTAVGRSLMDTLQEYVNNGNMTETDARMCMAIFYKSTASRLAEFNAQPDKIALKFEGQLDMYRYFNNIWTLNCESLKLDYVTPASKISKEGDNLAIIALEKKVHEK